MDLLFNIIFYGILALIPISLILVFAFSETKLVKELIDNSKTSVSDPDDEYEYPKTDWMYDPAYSNLSGNIYHDDKSN